MRAAKFGPEDRMIVSGSDDKTVKLWDSKSKSCVQTYAENTGYMITSLMAETSDVICLISDILHVVSFQRLPFIHREIWLLEQVRTDRLKYGISGIIDFSNTIPTHMVIPEIKWYSILILVEKMANG